MPGKAYLVGAGPGNLGLVTLRARQLVEQADVLIYDHLCHPEILRWSRPDAKKINAGKKARQHTLTQEQIHEEILREVRAGRKVVRLKGGDPYVFGRGGEEGQRLEEAGLEFEVVPGVTSAIAAPAYAGIPVTHRELASTLTIVTGHEDPTKEESALDWALLAREKGTRVFLMGVERVKQICERLIREGADPCLPAAMVRWGTLGQQQTLEGTLATLADLAVQQKFQAPAVIIIGQVVTLRQQLAWFEKQPLFGKRIVVTRTRKQASALSHQLQELGAEVLEIPTIKIVPQKLTLSQQKQLRSFSDHFDWLVFTSPNGVEHFFQNFFQIHRDIRALGPVKIATVGPATSQAVSQLNLAIEKQPKNYTTEALAGAFSEVEVTHQRLCLARGNLANPALAQILQEKKAHVEEWTLYKTCPENESDSLAQQAYCCQGAHFITFTSSSTVENWHALNLSLEAGALKPLHASIGPVTSQMLEKYHDKVDIEAHVATIPGLVEAILQEVQPLSKQEKEPADECV